MRKRNEKLQRAHRENGLAKGHERAQSGIFSCHGTLRFRVSSLRIPTSLDTPLTGSGIYFPQYQALSAGKGLGLALFFFALFAIAAYPVKAATGTIFALPPTNYGL